MSEASPGERERLGDGDSVEEQRAVGAKALPHDRRPRSTRKTEPTTFETLTKRHGEHAEKLPDPQRGLRGRDRFKGLEIAGDAHQRSSQRR